MTERHWTHRYIGRAYHAERFNCVTLVAQVAKDQLGLDVQIPSETEWRNREPEQVAELGIEYARETKFPTEYDIALMRIRGKRGDIGSHIGIHSHVAGEAWILHNLRGHGVLFVPERTLDRMFLQRVAYYRWKFA